MNDRHIMNGSFLIFVVDVFGDESVEGSPAFFRNDSGIDFKSIPLFICFDNFLFFKLLQTPPYYLQAGVLVTGRSIWKAILMAINVRPKVDTGSGAEVDLPGEGGHFMVDPIIIKGSQFAS
jgi:hypothetical protein